MTLTRSDGYIDVMAVESIAYVACDLPMVAAVRPVVGDFAQGKQGRILVSAKHGGGYHTTAKTTADDGPAQTEDQKVVISAYVEPVEADVTVYFEVLDPDDPVDNLNNDYQEDGNPVTPLMNAGDLLPAPNSDPNDNRDEARSMFPDGSVLARYNTFQNECLSSRSAVTVKREIDGVERAVAEVTLTITDRYAGDNYIVRATTIDPEGEPFNENSWVKENASDPDYHCWAGIPEEAIGQTATLTAWKRVYIQTSKMFRHGSDLALDAQATETSVTVDSAAGFNVNDELLIFDTANREGAIRTITNIDGDEIHFGDALESSYTTANHAHVGRLDSGFYEANTDDLEELWKEAFVEVLFPQETQGLLVPYRPDIEDGNAPDEDIGFSNIWFHMPTGNRDNYFHMIGAHKSGTSATRFGHAREGPPRNFCYVFVERIEEVHVDPQERIEVNKNVTAHEFTHQFDANPLAGQVIGVLNRHHTEANSQDGVVPPPTIEDGCIMNLGRDRTEDSKWCIFHVYTVRDEVDPTQQAPPP